MIFEGTHDKTDILYDLKIEQLIPYKNHSTAKVHRGFWEAYESVRGDIIFKLELCLFINNKFPPNRFYIGGHSLGAAMSIVSALDLIETGHINPQTKNLNITGVYSIAGPRVGNKDYAALFEDKFSEYYRITSERDPVVHLPPMIFGYYHIGHEYWYPNYINLDEYIYCETAEDIECADRYSLALDIDAHRDYLGIANISFCVVPSNG
jgi:predicted lipase